MNPSRSAAHSGRGLTALPILLALIATATPINEAGAADKQARRAKLPGGYAEIDGIAAVIGKQIVTLSELIRAQGRHAASQSMVPTDAERPRSDMAMLRQTLDSLIENALVVRAAQEMSLTISDAEIDEVLAQMRQKNLWDMGELRAAIRKLGYAHVAEYRDHIRTEKLRVKMLRVKLGSRLRVTEQEVMRILEAEFKGGTVEDEIRSRHILIKVPPSASPFEVNQLRRKAWAVYDQVKAADKSFAELAELNSDDLGTEEGGDLGFMRRWMLDPSFANKLWSLRKGEVSKVIQTPFGFHIIEMVERRWAPAKDKRILEQMVRARLTEQQFVRLYKAWMAELKASMHIEVRI